MKIQFNFHKRMAEPMLCAFYENYSRAGKVIGCRLWWSALTLTFYKGA